MRIAVGKGVPIYIQTGKALDKKCTELVVTFKQEAGGIFGVEYPTIQKNKLVFRFQPNTLISLFASNKVPGNNNDIIPIQLQFGYDEAFKDINYANGYDRIIYSILNI